MAGHKFRPRGSYSACSGVQFELGYGETRDVQLAQPIVASAAYDWVVENACRVRLSRVSGDEIEQLLVLRASCSGTHCSPHDSYRDIDMYVLVPL